MTASGPARRGLTDRATAAPAWSGDPVSGLRILLLGPVEVVAASGGPVRLARRQVRAVLAVLVLGAERVVPAERLCDVLWPGRSQADALPALHCAVARLRAALAAGAGGDVAVVSRGGGYTIEVDPDAVDAERFRRLVHRAQLVDDLRTRDRLLREALQLWRGPALQDCVDEPARGRLCVQLDELWLLATECRIRTGLDLGRHRELLPELARLAAEYANHESLVELHLRALVHAGRRGDALQAYARLRARLAEDFGVDPGPALQRAYLDILHGGRRPVTA